MSKGKGTEYGEFKPKEKAWNPDNYEIHHALAMFFDKVVIKDMEGRLILKTERQI